MGTDTLVIIAISLGALLLLMSWHRNQYNPPHPQIDRRWDDQRWDRRDWDHDGRDNTPHYPYVSTTRRDWVVPVNTGFRRF
jgi:hypothetical protein